tara:strand:- start:168 stop:671 length:504 start_codon:yes stop_codon:yes gene_type:complete
MIETLNKTKFLIDFGGFYHSIHSDEIDNKIEYFEIDEDKVNYKETYKTYCIEYLYTLNNILDLELEFIKIDSPQFYNFRTDKIEAEINENDFSKLKDTYLNSNEFIDYVNENSKSCSGFISFYNGFYEVIKEDEILLQYMFNYILKEYADDIQESLFEMEFEIIENN